MGKYKEINNNNKFKISSPTWNDEFAFLYGLHSVSNIEDYFEYILEKREPSVRTYVNKTENRITFKMKN